MSQHAFVVGLLLAMGLTGCGGGATGEPRASTPSATPSPSPVCVATAGPVDTGEAVQGWPGAARNPAGVYSWDKIPEPFVGAREGFMHNAYSPGSGDVIILIEGATGQLIPHRGQAVAGCEGTYRRFTEEADGHPIDKGDAVEEWMVDIQGTTVMIRLAAKPGAPQEEVAEAHKIIESIRAEPQNTPLGFRLVFTLVTNTWDSG